MNKQVKKQAVMLEMKKKRPLPKMVKIRVLLKRQRTVRIRKALRVAKKRKLELNLLHLKMLREQKQIQTIENSFQESSTLRKILLTIVVISSQF